MHWICVVPVQHLDTYPSHTRTRIRAHHICVVDCSSIIIRVPNSNIKVTVAHTFCTAYNSRTDSQFSGYRNRLDSILISNICSFSACAFIWARYCRNCKQVRVQPIATPLLLQSVWWFSRHPASFRCCTLDTTMLLKTERAHRHNAMHVRLHKIQTKRMGSSCTL